MENLAYLVCFIIMFFSSVGIVQCHPVELNSSGLVSDGIVIKNAHEMSSSEECVHAYGFFPCAESIWGYIYQIVVIQYLMSRGEKLLTLASTKIFTSLGTGIYGAVIFRILMALPTVIFMTVSGIASTKEDAQSQVSFAISVSAGSTIFNLTVLWGINVLIGSTKRYQKLEMHEDLVLHHSEPSVPRGEKRLANLFCGFSDNGVEIDQYTIDAAHFMFFSSIPFALMQLTNLSSYSEIRFSVIGLSLLFSFVLLFFYFRYQIQNEPAQEKSLTYARFEIENSVKDALMQFDQDRDGIISHAEFLDGVKRLIASGNAESTESYRRITPTTDEVQNNPKTFSKMGFISNVLQLLAGFAVLFILATPLTMDTQQLSAAIGLPPLVISFVVIPAVMNTRRAVAALSPLTQERNEVASMTFIELYNGVVMNNMMGLLAALIIVFVKDLRWNYSAEVLMIFVVCAIMGLFSWFRASSTYPKWSCFVALILYLCSARVFYDFAY